MSEAKTAAYTAVLEEIERQAKAVNSSGMNERLCAEMIRDLALAFRYLAGGAQPGSVVVESK